MPGKKGSRVAASQARAKANARKKARATGPDLAAARSAPEPTAESDEESLAVEESALAVAAPPEPDVTPASRGAIRRTASRRERQALTVISAASLKREVMMIGIITGLSGVALAVLKLATDLGR